MKATTISRLLVVFVAWLIVTVLTVGSFYMGRKYEQSFRPSAPTNLTVTETKPCPTCPEECVYNDRHAYKLIRFVHSKDGKVCYGLRSYEGGRFEAMWCGK